MRTSAAPSHREGLNVWSFVRSGACQMRKWCAKGRHARDIAVACAARPPELQPRL
jgi:hypothetical protein